MLVKAQREAEEGHAAPPPPQPSSREEFAHYHRPVGVPYMNSHVSQVDQLSRIRRLNDIELTHSTSLRLNFRDYMDDDIDDHYYSGYAPPPVPHEVHPYPPPGYPEPAPRIIPRGVPPPLGPPRPRYMTRGPPRPRYMTRGPPPIPPPPPPPHHGLPPQWPERPAAPPPPVGYPPSNYFSDENPNGCMVMWIVVDCLCLVFLISIVLLF